MKDEAAGVPIKEFVGLRSKMYSSCLDDNCIKKCKGIAKGVVKTSISFDDCKNVLQNSSQIVHNMKTIVSKSHKIKKL